jgi:dienelactone hydrolase
MTLAKKALYVGAAVVLAQSLHMAVEAQQGAHPAPLSPAPPTGVGKDAQGRLLPYGVPTYFTPDTPLGTGRYKAIMATDPSLPEHVLYYPKDLAAAGRMPVVVWANGSCMHAGNRSRGFLTEIASHGFLVISAGRMGHVALEVGAQENPFVARPGGPPAPPPAPPVENDPTEPLRSTRSTVDHMRQAIDWAIAQNIRQGSPFFNRIDVAQIGAGGQSCGGGLTTTLAADPRLKTIGIFFSGTRLVSTPGREVSAAQAAEGRKRLDGIHTPTIIITGDEVCWPRAARSRALGGPDPQARCGKLGPQPATRMAASRWVTSARSPRCITTASFFSARASAAAGAWPSRCGPPMGLSPGAFSATRSRARS